VRPHTPAIAVAGHSREGEEFIDKNGVMYPIKDDSGKIRCFQQWPQVAVAQKLCHELPRLEAEFG
jgi:hypothetical protein